jgi:hypothetical protein
MTWPECVEHSDETGHLKFTEKGVESWSCDKCEEKLLAEAMSFFL